MNQEIDRSTLIQIVDKCQNRTFADELVHILNITSSPPNDWLLTGLRTSDKQGISDDPEELQWRANRYGTNQKQVSEPPGFWELFFGALQDFTLRILIVASFLSIAIQVGTASADGRMTAWIQGFAILMAVVICATVTAFNDYQKQRQFLKLNEVADSRKQVIVLRNGQIIKLHQDNVLVGDIVQLQQGMQIPADGFLITANEITMDESAMTGETEPVPKNVFKKCQEKEQQIVQNRQKNNANKFDVPSPIVLSGTRMLTGEGKMVVIVVGQQSCLGKIRALLTQQDPEATPLQMKLEKIAEDIGTFGLYSAILIVSVLLIRFAIEKGISKTWNTSVDLIEILNYFILGITVIVVAIPQGLPLAVTLSLAFSVKKMLNDNNLVRRMEACETMGGANTICSDKTGTLTMNKMTLTTFWNGVKTDFDNYAQKLDINSYMNAQFAQLFKVSLLVNSNAILRPQVKGSSTEVALLQMMDKMGMRYEESRQKYPSSLRYPFSSRRKRMSTVCIFNGEKTLFVKGASELVLSSCTCWFNQKTNQVQPITQKNRKTMEDTIDEMANASLRTICVAYKSVGVQDLEIKDQKGVFEIEKRNLILVAILGVKDVPRPEVASAIQKCKKAGIKVRMVTGDNEKTARAIGRQVGIVDQNSIIMQGPQFHSIIGGVVCSNCKTELCDCQRNAKLAEQNHKQLRVDTIRNMAEFKKIVNHLDVLARSRPEDKYALVTGLKELGNVVAVTGDGTNDAPALKKADVGFAMGISGTEVARQAASIILLDDNFNSIVKAVMWGRNIYDSIKKFIQFQLTVNVVAVGITLIGAAILKQQILRPIQMLWVNLIMDTLASLALATQPPTEQLLDRAPHSRDQYIISKRMFKHIVAQSIYQLIVLLVLIFAGEMFIPESADQFDNVIGTNLQAKYYQGIAGGTIRSGRLYYVSGGNDYQTILLQYGVYSRHFTFIFNTFVMMQVFNFFNARKLKDQINVFEGLTNNCMFVGIVIAIFVLQVLLITFGSIAFGVYSYYGLNIIQWLLSIAIASMGLIVSLFAKMIPEDKICFSIGNKQLDPMTNPAKSLSWKRRRESFQRNLSLNNR